MITPPPRPQVAPLFTLAGSKRKAAPAIFPFFPKKIRAYVEPFAGSAAMLCYLVNNHPAWAESSQDAGHYPALGLFDGDQELWRIYDALCDAEDAERLLMEARRVVYDWRGQPEGYFASVRVWNTSPRPRSAALQLALRCHTFNGVWRQSGRTGLNVPPNSRLDGARLPSQTTIEAWNALLDGARLCSPEYRLFTAGVWDVSKYSGFDDGSDLVVALESLNRSTKDWDGEFVVYLDPPYVGKFSGYIPGGFSAESQMRTLEFARELHERGYFVAWSNSNCAASRELLRKHWPQARVETITVQRSVAADKLARVDAPELLALSS